MRTSTFKIATKRAGKTETRRTTLSPSYYVVDFTNGNRSMLEPHGTKQPQPRRSEVSSTAAAARERPANIRRADTS